MNDLKSAEKSVPVDKSGHSELAAHLARELLGLGDNGEIGECRRIQFKLGRWPGKERDAGGMCEAALVKFFDRRLAARPDLVAALSRARGEVTS